MSGKGDIEDGRERSQCVSSRPKGYRQHNAPLAFLLGIAATLLTQYASSLSFVAFNAISNGTPPHLNATSNSLIATGLPTAGSTVAHNYPPLKPTNVYPSLFPSDVGYAGGTPTGAEPGAAATAPANQYGSKECAGPLMPTKPNDGQTSSTGNESFNIFRSWGGLSPWHSMKRGQFGIDSEPLVPDTCRLTELHLLHRHGARYPGRTSGYGSPNYFAPKLHDKLSPWKASGNLEFLNTWTYKLGEEVLTPFGRQQMYDLGVSMRLKYGFLLQNFTEKNSIPVFRTESQDRMLQSAVNFALGFFGHPLEGKYQQSITIEAVDISNSLAPYTSCAAAFDPKKNNRGGWYLRKWADIYLKDAPERLQKQFHGLDLSIEDVYSMQQLCPFETVALGYSKFCGLFTQEEWEGFDYSQDLYFWYSFAFGAPLSRALGIGYVQELVARLTHTPISVHNSSTNSTLDDNPITFPLDQSLYVDATHDSVILAILTALNITSLAQDGPLPYTHILRHRKFRGSEIAPFGSNVQFQLLECPSQDGPQIRIIVNDGVVPLTGIKGCHEQKDGMCPLSTFINAMKEIITEVDWNWTCSGNWTVPPGPEWETVIGYPPSPLHST